MRQQFADTAYRLDRQASQDILQIGQRFMAIDLCGLDEAHDAGSAFAGAQAARK